MTFLLDAVGLNWSSFDMTGGIALLGQRCLHTAIAVTGEDIDNGGDALLQKGGPNASPSSADDAGNGDGAASPAVQRESIDATAAAEAQTAASSGVILWNPVGPAGRGSVPVSARSADSEKVSTAGAAAAKKKPGAKDGATAAKKAGSKEQAKTGSDSCGVDHHADDNIASAVPDAGDGGRPMFERILIFGGIMDEAAVSGVSTGRNIRLNGGWSTTQENIPGPGSHSLSRKRKCAGYSSDQLLSFPSVCHACCQQHAPGFPAHTHIDPSESEAAHDGYEPYHHVSPTF